LKNDVTQPKLRLKQKIVYNHALAADRKKLRPLKTHVVRQGAKEEETMDTQLLTLSKIFTERLFRIPDYQRGYAWTEKHLKDFWNDIQQLEHDHNHYTGVLTLEGVGEDVYQQWEDDLWIIEAKSYQPYFVVDGQQRLTTAIILIQTIIECIQPEQKLNFTDRVDIQRRFIFDSKDDGISRSYVFGYERDNPSYEFLKTKIFCERSSTGQLHETVYTQNLEYAKSFFTNLVASSSQSELEALYRKVTQQLLFNIFTITVDVDVCVAFETMNNRGKPLSYLELLKNRLIYLSLKFDADDHERLKLRRAINDAWKALYHNLGRNKEKPLDDDKFLFTHYITYFGKTLFKSSVSVPSRYHRIYSTDYSSDLLENKFVTRNVMPNAPAESKISLQDIYRYVSSLQDAVQLWYKIWNPLDSDLSDDTKLWLDKLNRIGMSIFLPLVLAFLQSIADDNKRVLFLRTVERHLFILTLFGARLGYHPHFDLDPQVLEWAVNLTAGKLSAEKIIKQLSEFSDEILKKKTLQYDITNRFRSDGFYKWDGIRYFLFEYNLDLQSRSKTQRPKIFWPEFSEAKYDFVSVEHIYPRQARHSYWTRRFTKLTQKHREMLRNSLGNLLPLSKPKNSSLSNNPFPDKVDGKKDPVIGYRYGSYAENEVAKEQEWTPGHILSRGLVMLKFMERRWRLEFGTENQKMKMLGLDFMNPKKRTTKASSRRPKGPG